MSRWRQDNVVEELDDEEIARILQEEEYEIARQQQREAQQRQQQQAKTQAAAAAPRRGSGPVAPASNEEVLLLQTRCSAVSGTTVLKGSCYLYRNMLKFVCVERGKEVDVSIYIATIELINPACSIKSKDSLAPPRIVTSRGAEQNVLQIYTQDKRIHTFFNFADSKTFQQVFNILSSIHKNNTAVAPPSYPAVAVAATSPSPPATMPAAGSPMFTPGPMGVPAMMAPPMVYPGMYMQGAHPGAFPPQPQYFMMPPHGFPAHPLPPQAQAVDSTAQAADFHLAEQIRRLQIQQQYPQQQQLQQDASGQQPLPQAFMPPPYYYPYPPAPAALHPAPTAGAEASAPSGEQQTAPLAAAMPPPYYYPPPMPYAMPTGAEMQQPYAPYPYAYAAPPTQSQQLPPQTTQQQQQQQPPQQQQQAQPRPSGPPEDLLA